MNTEEGVVDSPQPTDVSEVSTDDLRNIVATQPEAEAEVTETEAEAQPEETQEPPTEETSTTEEIETPEETEERLAKRRIRPRNELDQQVIDLYRSDGFSGSFADASRVIYGQQEAAPQAQPDEVYQPDPFAGYDAETEALQNEIAQLEIKVTEAADNLETADALSHQREIMRRELQIQSLSDHRQRETRRQQDFQYDTHRTKAVESRDKAYESYPELQEKSGVYRKQFDDFVSQAQSDPDLASVFQSPRWPEIMAHDFAARTGASQAPEQAHAVPPQQSPAMGNQAKVLTTGTTAQTATAPMSATTFVDNMADATNEQLYAALGTPDGRRALT